MENFIKEIKAFTIKPADTIILTLAEDAPIDIAKTYHDMIKKLFPQNNVIVQLSNIISNIKIATPHNINDWRIE